MARRRSDNGDRATIFDVAAQAGVSIKTVSRVVNNEPNVSEKTREQVAEVISKLNYQPNSAARGLSSRRSFVIGLAYENPHEFSYMKDVLNGVLEACELAGYSLLLRPVTLPDEQLVEQVRRFAKQTRLDGIVLPAPLCDMPQITGLMSDLGIPVACIAPRDPVADAINVVCNDEEASFALTEYLISRGHDRIGFIKGHPDHGSSIKRLAGYKRALKAHGIPYSGTLVKQGYFDFDSGKSAAIKLLNLAEPPTAIMAGNDDMAAGVIFEAHEKGLSIPEQLAVVGFDDTPVASHIWPPLTTVRQPIVQMAKAATDLLIRRLRDPAADTAMDPLHCEMVVRASTAETSA